MVARLRIDAKDMYAKRKYTQSSFKVSGFCLGASAGGSVYVVADATVTYTLVKQRARPVWNWATQQTGMADAGGLTQAIQQKLRKKEEYVRVA